MGIPPTDLKRATDPLPVRIWPPERSPGRLRQYAACPHRRGFRSRGLNEPLPGIRGQALGPGAGRKTGARANPDGEDHWQ
jgi:hypothetical protein